MSSRKAKNTGCHVELVHHIFDVVAVEPLAQLQVAVINRREAVVMMCRHPARPSAALVHPTGGLVGGDTLKIDISAHGLITTPGATRFYLSLGKSASSGAGRGTRDH